MTTLSGWAPKHKPFLTKPHKNGFEYAINLDARQNEFALNMQYIQNDERPRSGKWCLLIRRLLMKQCHQKWHQKQCNQMPRHAFLNDLWGTSGHIPIFDLRDKLNASTVSRHSNELIASSRGALWKRQVGANQKR